MTRASDTARLLGAGGSILGSLDVGGGQIGGRRNIIINGAMQVAQRSVSVTGIGASAGYFTLDRFRISPASTAGRLTMTQTADGPSGFANCLKLDCTTADASIAAGERLILQHKIEGQDLQQLKKGTSDAEEFTVSFYVKGNASATYVVEIFDLDNTRQISKTFSVTTGWTRVILTFPADTTGALGDDNAASLQIGIWLHAGSTYTSGTLNSSAFGDGNTSANRAVGISSFFDSTDRTFFLTGLQMELGSVATPFEHRSFGEELASCQRYCQRFPSSDQADGGAYSSVTHGFCDSTTTAQCFLTLPTTMRLEPTITASGNWRVIHENTATAISSGPALTDLYSSVSTAAIIATVGSTALTAGSGAAIMQNNDADANLILDSEL